MGSLGKNTPSAERLREFVERIERVDDQKKALGDDRRVIMAELKAEGFAVAGVKHVLKARKQSSQDREDDEAVRSLYLHVMGMDDEPPLFRQLGSMAATTQGRDQVIEAMMALVPIGGEIIVRIDDNPMRIWRDKDGNAHSALHFDAPSGGFSPDPDIPPPFPTPDTPAKATFPDCTPDEAEELGRQAARDGAGVITNPFPHDDQRRPRWDSGWRDESGSDGMGPKKKKK